jgi:hypothetical protein
LHASLVYKCSPLIAVPSPNQRRGRVHHRLR